MWLGVLCNRAYLDGREGIDGLGVLWPNLGLLWMASSWLVGWIPPRQRGWTAMVFHVSAVLLTIPGCIVAQSGGSW